ncbi:enoyl-CoA hydratase/isomerase family protein [uncultured Piscinibacter sp.]|uniref:enoyl-CoA hydratase/isomerase family protein n=1 Tax=uncultured Piscinibacter sp. TaxID=1131835 RepID=UPI00260A2B00|nr:enoyl-CoA hydratase/isomerase family protein [uncultured Piscinibacter sp.]
MPGSITLERGDVEGVAHLTLANPDKLNAIDIAMWRELHALMLHLQQLPAHEAPHAVIVRGADRHFAAGGDIVEFASFRFEESSLRDFHENVVAPALHAMLACDIPLFAQIEGHCIGGGLEIAACCDIRVCGEGSRFGAPIAKLGFPMAPLELQVVARLAGAALLREMLLEARLLSAVAALQHGLVHAVVPDAEVATHTLARARALALLSPQAARINKRTLRQIAAGGPGEIERLAHYAYADSDEHREGVMAFIEKRTPRFQRG